MALSKDRNTDIKPTASLGALVTVPQHNNCTVYEGGMVCSEASGYFRPAADTAGLHPVYGICDKQSISASTDSDGDQEFPVRFNVLAKLKNSGSAPITVTDVGPGHICYVEDDETVALSDSNGIVAGVPMAIDDDGGIWVWIGPDRITLSASDFPITAAMTQTYSTASATVAAATTNAITDNSGGTPSTSALAAQTLPDVLTDNSTGTAAHAIAAGAGVETVELHLKLAKLADGDIVTTWTPGFKFKILSWEAIVTDPATTGAKASTLNLEIGTTNLTGGALALTSANCTPLGAVVAAAAITAANTGSASDTVSLEASSTTTFIEGEITLVIHVQNMDTADAVKSLSTELNVATAQLTVLRNATATLAAELALTKADLLERTKNINAVIDRLQTLGLVG